MLAVRNDAQEAIYNLQSAMEAAIANGDLLAADCEVTHHFAPHLYARQMKIKSGVVIVGKIHKHAHINTISKGRIRVFTEFSSDIFDADIEPITFTSIAGTKRAVYAETDTVWTTYHPTDETDLEKIEAEVIAKNYEELHKLAYSDIKGLIL
jgi:hypothetical protein